MSLMDPGHPMYMTIEQLIGHVKPLMKRLYNIDGKGHPEDLVSSLVPMLEAWADGWGTGYQRGLEAGRVLQKQIDEANAKVHVQ